MVSEHKNFFAIYLTLTKYLEHLFMPAHTTWLQSIPDSVYNYLQKQSYIEVVPHLHFFLFIQLLIQLIFF